MVKVNNLTCLSTISSARISFMVHPPPMRNEIFLPTIRKQGEMRVPWGGSPLFAYSFPAGSLSLGRFSAPPIHQSPCCWALSLLRAAGLSPNVGCWMKAVPVISHPSIPSSKSRLQASEKEKKQMFICWILYDYHSILKVPLHSSVLTFLAVCASEPWRTFTTKSFISVSSLTSAIVETGNSAAWILIKKKMTAYYKYPWLVITYSQRTTVLLERWLLIAFWSSEY